MRIDGREVACGALFVIAAALFAYGTVDLSMGSAIRMGPGYFPLLLAIILGALGLIIVIKGLGRAPSPIGGLPWRGLLFILAGPIVFGYVVRGLGLAPAIALVALIATLSSAKASLLLAIVLTAALTISCVVVFSYGLGLPYALVGPWLTALFPGS